MVKITLESREAFQAIEDRLNNAVSDYVEKATGTGSQRKVIRGKLAQITTCFMQKVKRNTRLMNDEWSSGDEDEDEREAKRQKKERLEPEDFVLKSRVEDLKRKVQDAAKRVKAHRQAAPARIQEATKENLEHTNANFEQAISAENLPVKAGAANKPDLSISEASKEAFAEDCGGLSKRVAALSEELPRQIAAGRSSLRVCKEWVGKPLSGADAVMAEGAQAGGGSKAAQARRAKVASALRSRQ